MDRLSLLCGSLSLLFAASVHAHDPFTQQGPFTQQVAFTQQGQFALANIVDGYSTLGDSPATPPWMPHEPVAIGLAGKESGAGHRVAEALTECDPPCPAGPPRRPVRRFRVGAGYEVGWLKPRFTDNVSVVIARPSGNQAVAFEQLIQSTPRLWVGIENSSGLGVRARYWDLATEAPTQVTFAQAGASPLSFTIEGAGGQFSRTAVANVGDALTSKHRLEMRTIDFEGTQRMQVGRFATLSSFGLRYAKTSQRAHAVVTDGTGSLTELACQFHRFEGFGPTAAVSLSRCLFGFELLRSRVSFWSDARGSILFGQQEQRVVLVTGGGAGLAEDDYLHDDLLPTTELAGGLQLQCRPMGNGLWTIRTGYRGEAWFGVGGPINTNSNIGLSGVILSLAASW